MNRPAITVYVISHNYGKYINQAVESVFSQTRMDWELIIIDDGSKDDSAKLAELLRQRDPDRTRVVVHSKAIGLQKSANEALRLARGKYIIRLDADDYLDENAFLALGHQLDTHDKTVLVYPSYVYVDEEGHQLGVEHRWRLGLDTQVFDQPAHGACTMVRRRILKAIGGYDEAHERQDGQELWLKVINRYEVAQLSTPLFYYRQHGASLSSDRTELLKARALIKRALVERNAGSVAPRILAVVSAKNTYRDMPNIVLNEIAGKPLISYTIESALAVPSLDRILVSTDDQAVVDYCTANFPLITARTRSPELSASSVREMDILRDSVDAAEEADFWPDIIIHLSVHAPLRQPEQIQKGIDTLLLYDVDSVISVHENQNLYYVHGERGLEPLNPNMHRKVRVEREALYEGNDVLHVHWRDALDEQVGFKPKVGHIVVPRWDGFQVKSQQDAWLAEQLILSRSAAQPLRPLSWTS
jgi:glycosyltransferase involved in cell wall biosynthesis